MICTRSFVIGIMSVSILTIYLTPEPERISFQEKVDTLALILDGGNIINPHELSSVPIPKRKPEQGYTLAFRQDMDDLFKELKW